MGLQSLLFNRSREWGRVVPSKNKLFHYIIIILLFIGFFSLFYKLIEAYLILNVLHTKNLDSTYVLLNGFFSSFLAFFITVLLRFRFLKHEIIEATAGRYTWLWVWQILDFIVGITLIYLAFNASFL